MRTTLLLIPPLLSGCAGLLGSTTAGLNSNYILPAVLASGDVGVGCAGGEGLGALVDAFAPYSAKAARATVLPRISAGMCLEDDVREAQLQRARAYRSSAFAEARDAQALEERAHLIAASRYLGGWEALVAEYGVPDDGEACPKLKDEMDQLAYLLGLSGGVLAVLHDLGAQGAAGVPQTIPAAVTRGAACLDDSVWWGVPTAMQASLWALQPGRAGGEDVWAMFDQSVAKGEAAGVRLSTAYMVQTAATVGQTDRVRAGITRDAAHRAEHPGSPAWAMLDTYAGEIVRHESDRIWTELAGHRTPLADLGRFPDTAPPEEGPALDLLDGGLFQ